MSRTAEDQLDSCPEHKAGLVAEQIDGETVVYDPEADQLHHLDRSATAVWRLLDGTRPLRFVAGDIAAAYGVAEEVARRDAAGLTVTLRDLRLLAGSGPATTSSARPRPTGLPGFDHDHPRPLPPAGHAIGPFRALHHSFRIATTDPAVADYLYAVLVDLQGGADDGSTGRYELIGTGEQYIVRYDDDTVIVTGSRERASAVLLWHINSEVVRRTTPHFPVVHAAAAVADDRTVLLPAAPGSGKTTTVAGLVDKAGFGYVTDEAVAIDPTTHLPLAYPKPLSIDRGSWDVLAHLRPAHDLATGQWQVPARSIRPNAVVEPGPIGLVIEPVYDPDATTRLEPVTRAAMLLRLADSTFNFPEAPEHNLRVLAGIVGNAECYRLPISVLDRAVSLISDLCSPSVSWKPVPPED